MAGTEIYLPGIKSTSSIMVAPLVLKILIFASFVTSISGQLPPAVLDPFNAFGAALATSIAGIAAGAAGAAGAAAGIAAGAAGTAAGIAAGAAAGTINGVVAAATGVATGAATGAATNAVTNAVAAALAPFGTAAPTAATVIVGGALLGFPVVALGGLAAGVPPVILGIKASTAVGGLPIAAVATAAKPPLVASAALPLLLAPSILSSAAVGPRTSPAVFFAPVPQLPLGGGRPSPIRRFRRINPPRRIIQVGMGQSLGWLLVEIYISA